MAESETGSLPGFESAAANTSVAGSVITGKVDPTASGAEGAATGSGGGRRESPKEALERKRGPGRPKGSKNRPKGSEGSPTPSEDTGEGNAAPPPPVASSQPPPVDDFVPWKADDFVGAFSGAFGGAGYVLYPEGPQRKPWNDIGGGIEFLPDGSPRIIPPSPAVLLMAERAAAVANKWRLRLILKEEMQLIAAVGMGVFACVMASEEIRAKEKRAMEGRG